MNLTKKQKAKVFKKNGYSCTKCMSNEDLTIDHIRPKSKGGNSLASNLQTLCKVCNQKKSNYYPII